MLDFLGKLTYPVFGIAVLLGYVYCVTTGVEPFEADSEKHTISGVSGGRGYYGSPSVFRYGGFGGK